VCAALLFSTGGVAIKACGLSNWQVAGLRSGIAAVTVLALMPSARQIPSPGTLGVGVAYAGTLIAFVLANKLTTAANTIYLQSTAPLYLLVLGPWLLHERIRVRDLLFGLCLAVGLGLFFVGSEPPRSTAPDPTRGNLLAIGSGLLWALTLTGLRALGRRGTAGTNTSLMAVVAGNTIAFLVCLPWMLPIGPTLPQDWILIGYLGVFQIGLAYVCLTSGIGQVRAFEAALLLLVEPVFNPLWAWAIHGERPGAWALAGGATILSATVLRSWWDYRSGPPEAD
jgi:drug/metabolite transporter (DMT)-like permease